MVPIGAVPFLFAKKEGAREGSRTVAGDLAAGDRERRESGCGCRGGGGEKDAGAACARQWLGAGLIEAAALRLLGETMIVGMKDAQCHSNVLHQRAVA